MNFFFFNNIFYLDRENVILLGSDGESVLVFMVLVHDRCWIFIRFSYIFPASMDTTEDVSLCNWVLFARF